MRHLKLLLGLLCALLSTGCSHDAPTPDAPTEDYLRAFIKEFGVPQKDHDFSMARSAGLKVKASKATSIVVTAVVDGTEYLFADLTVEAGYTALPVTIPSDVASLNIHIGEASYPVAPDGLVDLDELQGESRTISVNRSNFTISEEELPTLAIQIDDWLLSYFSQHKIGENNRDTFRESFLINKEEFQPWNIMFGSSIYTPATYYVFPVFWERDQNGRKNYKISLHGQTNIARDNKGNIISGSGKKITDLNFNNAATDQIPFPYLGYARQIDDLTTIDLNDLSAFTFDDGSFDQFYNIKRIVDGYYTSEKTLISKGYKINAIKEDIILTLGLEIDNILATTDPQQNRDTWDKNYYGTTLENLKESYAATRVTPAYLCAAHDADFAIHENGEWKTYNYYGSAKKRESVLFVGFEVPPTSPSAFLYTKQDFAKVLFLVIPTWTSDNVRFNMWKYYPRYYPTYTWTIAVEDLGGSFDWDFNDAVFRFTDVIKNLGTVNKTTTDYSYNFTPKDAVSVRMIEVEPLAAGGTMPLYITYTGKVLKQPVLATGGDMPWAQANGMLQGYMNQSAHDGTYIIGTEIHKWLGASTHTKQLNTTSSSVVSPGQKISFAIPTSSTPSTATLSETLSMSALNQPLQGFAVLVDKDNHLNIDAREGDGFVAMPDLILGQGNNYLIGRPDETKDNVAPQMILLSGDTWEWPRECVNIKDAYPGFADWVSGASASSWTGNKDSSKVTRR